jgi:hypothetical protein
MKHQPYRIVVGVESVADMVGRYCSMCYQLWPCRGEILRTESLYGRPSTREGEK